jgi:hypothetical protein
VSPAPAAFGPDIVTPAIRDVALQALDYYGVRYVVVHPLDTYPAAADLRRALDLLFGPTGETRDGLTVYTTPHAAQDRAFLYLGDGWHDAESDPAASLRWRWTEQRATIRLVVPEGAAGAYAVGLDAYSVAGARTLVATLDGREVARAAVAPAPGGSLTVPLTLSAGEHTLILASVESAIHPPGDARAISLGYHRVALTRR